MFSSFAFMQSYLSSPEVVYSIEDTYIASMRYFSPPNRVLQLDAKSLDSEVYNLLKTQLTDAISSSPLNSKYLSEFKLLLKLLIFKVTVWDKSSTYGLTLQNLVMYDNKKHLSKSKKYLLLLSILGAHFYSKFESYLYSLDEDPDIQEEEEEEYVNEKTTAKYKKIKRLRNTVLKLLRSQLKNIHNLCLLLSFTNFLIFLVQGKYPNLLIRLLRIRYKPLVSTQVSLASNPETISYEFQNRQLVWNTLTEFIVFILPSLNVPKFTNSLLRWTKSSANTKEDSEKVEDSTYKFLPERVCAVCYQNAQQVASSLTNAGNNGSSSLGDISLDDHLITNPYETSCGHVYCFVCLIGKLETFKRKREEEGIDDVSDEGYWKCLRCNELVEWGKVYDQGCESLITEKLESIGLDDEDEEDDESSSLDSDSDSESESHGAESDSESSVSSEEGDGPANANHEEDEESEAYDYEEEEYMDM